MNSRRFTAQYLPCFRTKGIAHLGTAALRDFKWPTLWVKKPRKRLEPSLADFRSTPRADVVEYPAQVRAEGSVNSAPPRVSTVPTVESRFSQDARLAAPRGVAPAMLFGRRKDAWRLRRYSVTSWVVATGLGGTSKPSAGRRPRLAERLNSLFTQSDGIALSS